MASAPWAVLLNSAQPPGQHASFAPTDVPFSLSEPLGMSIDPDNLDVVSVVAGAQAQRRGVTPLSRIVAVDGVAIASYDELLAQRQARIDAGTATFALRFANPAPAAASMVLLPHT